MRDGTELEFNDVYNWTMGDYRLLIVLKPEKKTVMDKDGNRKSIALKAEELVFLCSNIFYVKTIADKEIDDSEELRKYDLFLERGVDILVTEIATEAGPDVNEVKRQIKREQKGLLEKNRVKV